MAVCRIALGCLSYVFQFTDINGPWAYWKREAGIVDQGWCLTPVCNALVCCNEMMIV